MNILKLMILAILIGFASSAVADIDTPEWEEEIRQPAVPPICKKISGVRNTPDLIEPAKELAKELLGLLGKPSEPIRQLTCGRGEGSLSLLAGVDIVDEVIRTLREAELTPHDILPGAGGGAKGIRAKLLEDVRAQVDINRRGGGAENGGANDAVQRAMEEYNFTPAELGFTPEEIQRGVLMDERQSVLDGE